ncbi:MAG: hypothetical protein ABFC81_03905 [Rectinema sp.]
MDSIIETLKYSGTTAQAIGVSIFGLIGVFATLGLFFVLILAANKVGGKKRGD